MVCAGREPTSRLRYLQSVQAFSGVQINGSSTPASEVPLNMIGSRYNDSTCYNISLYQTFSGYFNKGPDVTVWSRLSNIFSYRNSTHMAGIEFWFDWKTDTLKDYWGTSSWVGVSSSSEGSGFNSSSTYLGSDYITGVVYP